MSEPIIIIGGGLAGLTCAIHLAQRGLSVTLIEKGSYPRHKVCGEFLSNEILPYWDSLGIDLSPFGPVTITNMLLSTVSGKTVGTQLPIGGFGISRYTLDKLLYEKAKAEGVTMLQDTVTEVSFDKAQFTITLASGNVLYTDIAIGAYGKRANIDQKLQRPFFAKKSPWLAVKAHYSGNVSSDTVQLHNFIGGYCGVSMVAQNTINICYLADYKTFGQYRDTAAYETAVLYRNPQLKRIFENCDPLFDKPLTISQVSFDRKSTLADHMLMIGDTAGLIHPLCGNGMAMAVHSAKIAAELVQQYRGRQLTRTMMEDRYLSDWNLAFSQRMNAGRLLGKMMQSNTAAELLIEVLATFPSVLPAIIRRTHGKPLMPAA